MKLLSPRPSYRPSWQMAWGPFLFCAMLTVLLALALATGVNWLYSKGWYLVVVVPCAASGLLLGFIALTITRGKCRIPALAGLFGFFAGALFYGSYLYFGMLTLLGPTGLTRFDLLPNYISLRSSGQMRTFTFEPDDRRFATPGCLRWLDPRYLRFDTPTPSFIDISTMKLGHLPTCPSDDHPIPFTFSSDFRWALAFHNGETLLGRVVKP